MDPASTSAKEKCGAHVMERSKLSTGGMVEEKTSSASWTGGTMYPRGSVGAEEEAIGTRQRVMGHPLAGTMAVDRASAKLARLQHNITRAGVT